MHVPLLNQQKKRHGLTSRHWVQAQWLQRLHAGGSTQRTAVSCIRLLYVCSELLLLSENICNKFRFKFKCLLRT